MSPASPCPDLDELVVVGGPVGLDHRFLDRPWGRQHVVVAGPAGADALVLVHGWPQHWFAWRHVLRALATEFRVVAVDSRGFGWSSTEPQGADITIGDLAVDIVRVLDDLDIGSAVLAAHDWGGWIGFRAVLDHPDRFRRYSALSIVPPWLSRGMLLRRQAHLAYVLPMAVSGDRIACAPRAVRWMMDHSSHEAAWRNPQGRAALASYVERIGRPESATMTRQLYATLVRHELPSACRERPGRLRVPTTVVIGEHEAISRPELYWSRTHPGELRVVTVPRANHWLAEEQPAVVIEHLLGQLTSGSAGQVDLEATGELPGPGADA